MKTRQPHDTTGGDSSFQDRTAGVEARGGQSVIASQAEAVATENQRELNSIFEIYVPQDLSHRAAFKRRLDELFGRRT